jgi:uncharacterized protein (UPF0371 family)
MRIHVIIEELSIEFWINDMPEVPRKDDHIDFSSMYKDESKELIEIFQNSTFMVESVTWTKDKDGYLTLLFCELTK